METEANGIAAWILPVDEFMKVAVGEFEFIHIVSQTEYFSIPQAPKYCDQVILWNENIVPVMDLSLWYSGHEQSYDTAVIAVLIYKNNNGDLLYGGIRLKNMPVLNIVTNDQSCLLPDESDKWKEMCLSCFKSSNGDVVPILDVARLFLQGAKY